MLSPFTSAAIGGTRGADLPVYQVRFGTGRIALTKRMVAEGRVESSIRERYRRSYRLAVIGDMSVAH